MTVSTRRGSDAIRTGVNGIARRVLRAIPGLLRVNGSRKGPKITIVLRFADPHLAPRQIRRKHLAPCLSKGVGSVVRKGQRTWETSSPTNCMTLRAYPAQRQGRTIPGTRAPKSRTNCDLGTPDHAVSRCW